MLNCSITFYLKTIFKETSRILLVRIIYMVKVIIKYITEPYQPI